MVVDGETQWRVWEEKMILSGELFEGETSVGEDVEDGGDEHEEVGGDGCHLLSKNNWRGSLKFEESEARTLQCING